MGRILAIDYGAKRVGLAVTDLQQIIATRLTTVNTKELIAFLDNYFENNKVDEVVIGYPYNLNYTKAEACTYIDPFIELFKKRYPSLPLATLDERFTSKMAQQAMINGGLKKMDRRNKALVDGISATIILQDFLTQKKYNNL